jgi:ABC-2 type transport system permease protein
MSELLKHAQSNLTITARQPQPVDGITNFVSQVNQTGLVVVVVVSAGALAFDARRGVSTFFRTRCPRIVRLVVPRFAVSALAAAVAYSLGTAAAWYETTLLLGPLRVTDIAAGWFCGVAYLVFAVAVVAASASIARTVLGTVGIALGALLALPLAGLLSAVHPWLPSALATAPVELLGPAGPTDYARALGATALVTVGLLVFATRRLQRREV